MCIHKFQIYGDLDFQTAMTKTAIGDIPKVLTTETEITDSA